MGFKLAGIHMQEIRLEVLYHTVVPMPTVIKRFKIFKIPEKIHVEQLSSGICDNFPLKLNLVQQSFVHNFHNTLFIFEHLVDLSIYFKISGGYEQSLKSLHCY